MSHPCEVDVLLPAVLDGDGLRAGLHLVVLQAGAAHAQVVIAALAHQPEVLLRGDARVHDYEQPRRRILGHGVPGDQRRYHGWQRLRVGGVTLQDGTVADEARRVHAQGQHQQRAVVAALFRTSPPGLAASALRTLEIYVGQVEHVYAFGQVEQAVRNTAQVALQAVFQLVQCRGDLVDVLTVQADILHARYLGQGGILGDDVEALVFRHPVDGAGHEQGHRVLHPAFRPALREQECVYLQLAHGLKAQPLSADVTPLLMVQRVATEQVAAGRLIRLLARNGVVHFARLRHLPPELIGQLA